MAICIYAPTTDDFSTNGLGILTPIECTVTEEAAGMYELELLHPIDETNRWSQIVCGAIIKAPAPVRESPLYEEGITGTQTVVNQIYKATKKVKLRQKTASNSKKLASVKKNTEVIVLETTGTSSRVMLRKGQVGYLNTSDLLFVREETSTVTQAAPVGVSTVHIALSRDQLFRVYSVETDSEAQTVHAKAMHIFYDLRGDLINADYNPVSIPAQEVVSTIAQSLLLNTDFEFHADGLSANVNGAFGYKSPVEALLDPDDGVVHAAGAIFLRDNYDVFVLPDYVRDRQVTIRRGKNLVGVTATRDDSNVVTRIVPVGKDVNGNDFLLSGSTPWVDSENIDEYPTIRVKRIGYDVKLVKKNENNVTTFRNNTAGQAAARAKMTELAQKDFADGADLPDYGMDVDFVILQNVEGLEQYASLQAIHLYDTVTVIDSVVGIRAKVRCTGYTWNCITEQYDEMTLGKLEELKQTVYSFNLPTGGVSGSKIAPATADGGILRDLSVQYAKISAAAIESLSADALEAHAAYIGTLTAQSIDTDTLAAAYANLFQIVSEQISAGTVTAGTLAAAMATLNEASIGTADIGYAQIVDATIAQLITHDAIADKFFIEKLMVRNLQVVEQTVGSLIVKASDGNYYRLDIDTETATVVPTSVTVSDGEITAGVTSDGTRSIIETDLTVADLSASNIKGINALIDRITAERIDVGTLIARQAFIETLKATRIVGDKTLEIIVDDFDNLEIGGRNYLRNSRALLDAELVTLGVYQTGDQLHVVRDVTIQQSGTALHIS